jgi:hypothetical protein
MGSSKAPWSQRDWLTLAATVFLASGLLTGLCVMVAAVIGWIRVS